MVMDIRIVQVVAFLLGVFFIYKSWLLVRNKKEDLPSFLVWVFIGGSLVILSINLDIINMFLGLINMSSRVNLLFTASVLLSLFLIFMLFKEVKNLELKISKLNEEMAILKYKKMRKR
mgnify:CR=1 FL=1